VVAAQWDCEFEQYAHEAAAQAMGLSADQVAAIRAGRELDLADPAERVAVATARALAGTGDLDDMQYEKAVAELGAEGVFELTTLAGYYATLALQLRVFRVKAPDPTPGTAGS
jgi:4-carboxymuconolactone decarboxylase